MALSKYFRLRRLRSLTTAIALLVIAGLIWGVWAWQTHHTKKAHIALPNQSSVRIVGSDANDHSPAKVTENTNSSSSQSTSNTPTKKTVTPFITRADQNEVDAYVSDVFEDGGTCTATFTKAGQTVTKTSGGFQNVSYTSCQPIILNGALSIGTWSLVVKYSSSTAEGQSLPSTIEVK